MKLAQTVFEIGDGCEDMLPGLSMPFGLEAGMLR